MEVILCQAVPTRGGSLQGMSEEDTLEKPYAAPSTAGPRIPSPPTPPVAGTKSVFRPADKPLINRGSTAGQARIFFLHRFPDMPCMKKVYKDIKKRSSGTLVSNQERRAAVVPLINRLLTASQPFIVFPHRFT